jgi:N6-adenosine-specific RNA methylase IME4
MVSERVAAGGLTVMRAWGFTYKSNLVWHKVRN